MIAKVVLRPGTQLLIEFEDEEGSLTDGQFSVDYDTEIYPDAIVIKENDGMPGLIKGGANEILYHDSFHIDEDELKKVERW